MTANEVRQSFLDFFKERDHKIVHSAPVVPQDDPTLLFTNAGMNQFKDVFLETGTRPYSRAVDAQKCIRVSGKHNDLEEVGIDTYHHTFFEMMGNWSFGDYYKEEAIRWAWELVTDVWGLPKERLWASVFREDDEAEVLWKKVTDIDKSRVLRCDEKDNFWEMGETGPCGPCSEIHIDLGEGYCDKQHIPNHVCEVNAGCARYIELWNLVFIQYDRDEQGTLTPLPAKHVDTGLGLERTVAVLQGKQSNYQTDLFIPIMEHVSQISGKPWGEAETLPAFRVIADHIRALTFAITDGAIPSNEGRGYVLRRILRRAARFGRNLGMHEPFIYRLVSTVIDVMASAYPEIGERAQHTTLVIKAEEERFNEVLDRGIESFNKVATDALSRGQKIISGTDAFRLYDTFGFPLDLTQLMAREKDLTVDGAGFQSELEAQRVRARTAAKFTGAAEGEWIQLTEGSDSAFIGYDLSRSPAQIRKYRFGDDGAVTVVLDQTPFYAESGGQVGDKGQITGDRFRIDVHDTQKEGDMILHLGRFVEGDSIPSAAVDAVVSEGRRLDIMRNHTATHLLQKALRETLGDHVNQSGSLVAPDRLRFDFTHFEAMTSDEIRQVEQQVNEKVRADLALQKFNASLDDAKAKGATALFGEKYDEEVRVVQIENYSMELCGGTHLDRTGQIGFFRIVKEEGIAAGVRRIEAITGLGAEAVIQKERQLIEQVENILKCRSDEILQKITALIDDKKELEKSLKKVRSESSGSEVESFIAKAKNIDGFKVVTAKVEVDDVDGLRMLGDKIRELIGSGVGVLGAEMGGKVNFLCVVTDDLIQTRKLRAGDIIKEVARIADGSGGGKPHQALAGGKAIQKLQEALDSAPDIIQNQLS